MSKTASLLFAVTSVLWMCATAISISYNGWLAAAFAVLTCANIAFGFITKAKQDRKRPKN
jgi:hypothetical protein